MRDLDRLIYKIKKKHEELWSVQYDIRRFLPAYYDIDDEIDWQVLERYETTGLEEIIKVKEPKLIDEINSLLKVPMIVEHVKALRAELNDVRAKLDDDDNWINLTEREFCHLKSRRHELEELVRGIFFPARPRLKFKNDNK